VRRPVLLVFLPLLLLGYFGGESRAAEFATLHEVVRHFQVAFVDRLNLSALLYGGLNGVKKVAPKVKIQILTSPDVYEVQVGAKQLTLDKNALFNFTALEKALVSVGNLVESQKPAPAHAELEHAIIRGMVEYSGDPWTAFLDSDIYNRLLDDGTTQRGDVGLSLEHSGIDLRVLDVAPDSPAFKAGIPIGGKLERIQGKNANLLSDLEALAMLRGDIGKAVEVVVNGKKHPLSFAPEVVKNIEVDPPRNGIARVHLLNFREGTGKRFKEVMQKLSGLEGGLKGLVLDLRKNPGGLVTEGTEVVGALIGGGKVVSVVSARHTRTEVEESPKPGPYQSLPLAILTDHRSASVSEIVCLALRDHGRAKLVGEKTLGKGTVQVVIELMDGSALKLSTGRYYSPKGSPLYEGIEPDLEVDWNGQGQDVQLEKAIALLQK